MLTAYKNIQAALVLMGCALLGACAGNGSGDSAPAVTPAAAAPTHADTTTGVSDGDVVSQSDAGNALAAAKSSVNFYNSARRNRDDDRHSDRCKKKRRPKRRCDNPPAQPAVTVSYGIKQVTLTWSAVSGASYYQVSKTPDGVSPYDPLADRLTATSYTDTVAVHLTDWVNARYKVSACNAAGCTDSAAIAAISVPAIGYVKASNTGANDGFGYSVALSGDGHTLAVGAIGESSNATSIDGNQNDNSAGFSGAVYVFTRTGSTWSQQAYIKASNTGADDIFGYSIALSDDGNTLAVGAPNEASNATGINGDQNDNSSRLSGAVYVFTRTVNTWSQQAYIKASNTEPKPPVILYGGRLHTNYDRFGASVALSGDGTTLAVGASSEASNATGINGDQNDNSFPLNGAVYVFTRTGGSWSQQAYIKASNADQEGYGFGGASFGGSVALSSDGNTLAVGAPAEDSSAQWNGAAYVFTRTGSTWSQQAYIKASNAAYYFGTSVALSGDGNTLAVGATGEASNATGIDGNQNDISAVGSGAVYVFTRSGSSWSQQAYIKASNTGTFDGFGGSVALSGDGNTLAVGASLEDSNATGIGGDQNDNSAGDSGTVYVFTRTGGSWSQQAYVKASNTGEYDSFGSVALSDDGHTLVTGARGEDSAATGINGDQTDSSAPFSGAVYVY